MKIALIRAGVVHSTHEAAQEDALLEAKPLARFGVVRVTSSPPLVVGKALPEGAQFDTLRVEPEA